MGDEVLDEQLAAIDEIQQPIKDEGTLSPEELAQLDPLYRDEEAMELAANLIYYIALGLLLGLALREVNKKFKLPYSPMVLICGLLLGLMQKHMGFLGASTSQMSRIHPHIILYVFIPILLFESAFNMDWYVFKRAIVNILILAGPGVCWGAILIGLIFKVLLFYGDEDMTWTQAFTLGSVLSATDPVAVVALLKELGASVRFNTLIESEALLNDGTAMVFFLFFCNLSKGGEQTVMGVVGSFVQNTCVGPLLGFFLAFIASLWTRKVIGDDTEVTWLTFVFAYICFYLAEFTFFHTSGILTVICLGLFWSAFGKTKIRPESEHAVHTVWCFVQYSADTLIFLLVGIIVGTEIILEDTIKTSDWIKMLFFFVFMIIARYIMIMTFWPLIKKYGYPISQPELIVLVYGGLRGALGLCLSLLVGVDMELPRRFRHLTVFYMASMAALTNLINGTTCKALVQYLNMVERPPVKAKIFQSYIKELVLTSEDKRKELSGNQFYAMADWNIVQKLTATQLLVDQVEVMDAQIRNSMKNIHGDHYVGISDFDMYSEVRYRLLRILKGLYYQKFEVGTAEEDACRLLVESSNINLDHTSHDLNIWELIFISFTGFASIQFWFQAKEYMIIGRWAQYYITRHLGFIYDVTTTFIQSANETILLIQHLPLHKNAVKKVADELQTEINKADNYLTNLHHTFPEVIRAIQTRRASYSMLIHQKHYFHETHENGLVDDTEYNALINDVNDRFAALENYVFSWEVPTFDSLMVQFPIFSMLARGEITKIISSQIEKLYRAGDIIYETGMTYQNFFIITKGNIVDELSQGIEIKKGLGSILSFANAISPTGKSLTTCRALTDCVCSSVSMTVVQEIMFNNPLFEEKIYLNSIDYLVKIYSKEAGILSHIEEHRLAEFLRHKSTFKKLQASGKIELLFGGYIFRGEIQSALDEMMRSKVQRYSNFCYVPPSENEFTATKDLIIVVFEDDIHQLEISQFERFNLQKHEDEVEKRYKESGLDRKSILDQDNRQYFEISKYH